MKDLSAKEMRSVNGGSETVKRFFASLKEAWCTAQDVAEARKNAPTPTQEQIDKYIFVGI